MNTRPNSYLEDNYSSIEETLREVFKASSDSELITGEIVHIDYKNDDCGSFSDLTHNHNSESKNYGPGIRIIVNFGERAGTHNYFYPENECHSLESFLDNMNTDFGMAQIMRGKSTASLNIEWYDLYENKIQFELNNQSYMADGFKDCWNVNTLDFDVNKFLQIRATFNKASDFNTRSVSKSLGNFSLPSYPSSVHVLGIDKNKFLNKHLPSNK